jgi:hypothetical protein
MFEVESFKNSKKIVILLFKYSSDIKKSNESFKNIEKEDITLLKLVNFLPFFIKKELNLEI